MSMSVKVARSLLVWIWVSSLCGALPFAIVSASALQWDAHSPEMLIREAIMTVEDTDMLIGGEVNLDAFAALKAGSTVDISVRNGVVYSVGDGVHLDASSKQQISTNDLQLLQSVMSNMRYAPNPNFNGIDEIDFSAQGLTAALYIYVQAENDPPKFEFDSSEMNDWYKYPRMFLPSFRLDDPDKDQTFQVDILVDNGTLFVEQISTSAFDGVSVEFNSSLSSLRLTSGLDRLNTLFLQRLVEIVPKSCLQGTTPTSCAALIELCANDGFITYCEKITLPQQDVFYHVVVTSWAKSLNITAGSSLNVFEAFKIQQRFDVVYDLLLRVHVSSGFFRVVAPNCGELRDFVSADTLQPSNLLGMTQLTYVGDAACLNKVLTTIQLQSPYGSNATVVISVELLSEEMRLLANESISVKVSHKRTPIQISVVRTSGDELWLTSLDSYANLTSLVNVSLVADPETTIDGAILELSVSCLHCHELYSGKDLLEVTVARFPSRSSQPNTSFGIPIDIVAVSHASTEMILASINDSDKWSTNIDEPVIPSWSQPSGLDVPDTLAIDELVVSLHSSPAPGTNLIGTEPESYLAPNTTALVPLIHIEGSVEGPLSSQYWEVITLALEAGRSWSISGIYIRDSSGASFVSDDGLTLKIDAEIGAILLAAWDGLQLLEGSDATFAGSITVVGKLDLLNAALLTLRYQCSGSCNRQDTVTLQVNNPFAPPPEISHKRAIRIDLLYDVPVPYVTTNASLHYSTEDAAFQFPNLTLRFADNNQSLQAIEYIQTEQRSQLWSAELSYRSTKYSYPRSRSDDKHHRFVGDFVGENPPNFMCQVGNFFYFAGSDGQHGEELWISDGSKEGTGMVVDLLPGEEGSSPTDLVAFNGKLIFTALGFDLTTGREMWASDGSAKQTYLIADIRQGPNSSNPQFYTLFQSKLLLFQAETDEFVGTDGSLRGEQQVPKHATNELKMEGTAVDLENDLNRMVYLPPQNWNEEQFPGGHIVEWQFVVSYENKSVETFADLVITPRVDIPVITVPQAIVNPFHYMSDYLSVLRLECSPLMCDEDTPMLLDGFLVRATDTTQRQSSTTDLLVLSLSVSHGVLTLGDPLRSNCISQFMGPQSRKRVSFKATADCMNRILSGMTYVGEPNFSGADQLKIRIEHARNLDAEFDEVTVPISVVELNDAPYIDVRSVFYEAGEDVPLLIEDLYLRDPDAFEEPLRVVMETSCGQLALLRPTGINLTAETIESGAMRLTLEGTLFDLNAAIAAVAYTSAKDWNSLQFHTDGGLNGFDTITISSSDSSSFNASSVSVLFVYVDPDVDPVVIDTPSNVLTSVYANEPPGTLRGDEDTWIGVSGLAFSSVDDTSQMTLVLSLSVVHGILSLSQLRGITFLEGTSDQASTVKVKGTFGNVNGCVAGLSYIPYEDYYGKDSLVVTAHAIDEYTQQQTPSSSISVAITIDPVNDAPVWNIGSSVSREIQQSRSASMTGVHFRDVDVSELDCAVESCVMDLIVEASHGFVTLSDQSSTSFSNDMTIKKVAYVVVSGTPDELNTVLSKMTFELAAPEYYRADHPGRTDIKLQLTVDDRGTFGLGGPQISTSTVVFSPVTWSHYDLSILAPEHVLEMDEDTAFGFNGDLLLLDPDSARSFHNLLELTVSCTSGVLALSSQATGIQVLRNESGEVVIRGYFAQLNAALNGSLYIPEADWYGSEKLSLSVVELNRREQTGSIAVATVFLFVAPVCDEPQWRSQRRADKPFSMKEDGYLLIDSMSLTNPDLDNEQREVEVSISVEHGGVMLSLMKGLLVQRAEYSTSEGRLIAQHAPPGNTYSRARLFFKELVVRGRVSDINSALNGMIFKPSLDYNSDGWPVEEISLVATSSCGGIENSNKAVSSAAIAIGVDAVNDPPILLSKHFQRISSPDSLGALDAMPVNWLIEAVEDLPQPLEPLELYDPDCDLRDGDLRLLVNVSCIHCTITSTNVSKQQRSDDLVFITTSWRSKSGTQLNVHGSLASLNNNMMNQLTFRGADNFNRIAFVLIEISDLGNYGEGGEQHTLFALGVEVRAVNDIPLILLPQYQSQEPILRLDEDASVLIVGAPALSVVSENAQQQVPKWSLVSADLMGNESTTRLYSLSNFSGVKGIAASFLVAYNGGLLFSGQSPDLGNEIWYSDGTAVGTVLLKDIFPCSGSSNPSYLTPFSKDNRVYFAAEGPHLSWQVEEAHRDGCQSFRSSSLDPDIYFAVAAVNVWDSEDTYDCPLGFRWMSTSQAQQVFLGTITLDGHSEEPLTYFDQCGWRGYEWGGQTRKYFRFSDSKITGAFKHAGFRDSYRPDTGFQTDLFAGIVCYRESPSYQVTWGSQLWATDGTAMGTQRVARISTAPEGSNPSHFVELNQRLYFQATSPEFGAELWSTDGTRAGTYLVADVEFGARSSKPRSLTVFDSRVYFSAETQNFGRELWFSNGDPRFEFNYGQHATVGTGLLLDICPGAVSSSPQHFAVLTSLLLFQADDCVHGPELWSTDGTRSGTSLVLDIRKGSTGSSPRYLTYFAGQVYFQADDGVHGSELWTTDGTTSGTVMLLDLAPGVQGSTPSFLTILYTSNAPSGTLVFAAQAERDLLTEFWQSDGTSVGTTKLFPQSREVVEMNVDSLDLQLAGNTLVAIPSQPDRFFYLGRESGQGIDFRSDAANRFGVPYAEDVAHTRSITLEDVGSMVDGRNLTLSLNCSKGWLSLGKQCSGVTVSRDGTPDQTKAAVVTLEGTLDVLNCAVERLTYHAKPQENGWDEIHVTLSQGVETAPSEVESATSTGFDDNSERDSSYTVSKRMLVEIRAINDPPSIGMASMFYAPLRQWVAFAGIEVADPDSAENMLYVSISVRNGRLRVTLPHRVNAYGPTALHPTADGDISQVLEFATTVEQAMEIFSRLEYSCDAVYGCSNSQRDYLTVQVDDNGFSGAGGPQVATKTAEIIIMAT
ncbi:hypothetical protein PF006_g5480 [Phytophthora fragariae]|uniref:Cadherin domain-containing protein n=1 Tax=Phytophthora fragariae TaxID=53985 RepID=A0A6A3UEW4_9STRA|nr:hypothetical protein PF006_g5480 [Phytophthora fragariae]